MGVCRIVVTLNDESDASDATLFRLEPLYLYNGSETVVHPEQFFRIGCAVLHLSTYLRYRKRIQSCRKHLPWI